MNSNSHIDSNDLARYRKIVQDLLIEDDRKEQVISIVHRIMKTFVDCAFEADSTQITLKYKFHVASQHDGIHVIVPHQHNMNVGGRDVPGPDEPGM